MELILSCPLWRSGEPNLPNNNCQAEKRLRHGDKRLSGEAGRYQAVHHYIRKGCTRRLSDDEETRSTSTTAGSLLIAGGGGGIDQSKLIENKSRVWCSHSNHSTRSWCRVHNWTRNLSVGILRSAGGRGGSCCCWLRKHAPECSAPGRKSRRSIFFCVMGWRLRQSS